MLDVSTVVSAYGMIRSPCKLLDISIDVIKAKAELSTEIQKKKMKLLEDVGPLVFRESMSVRKTSALLKTDFRNKPFRPR